MRRPMARRGALALGALITTLLSIGGLTATPAAADPPPDLVVTVAYGQASYNSTDTSFSVTLTITNNSDLEADGLRTFVNGPCVAGVFGWPKLGTDFTVPGHGTVTDTETGGNPINGGVGGTATCSGALTDLFGQGINVPYSTSVPVNQVFGDYHSVLYRDRNHDGKFEDGEGVAGITAQLVLEGSFNDLTETATSGPDGQINLTHIPVGTYGANFSSRRNWVIDDPDFGTNEGTVTVTEAAQPTRFLPVIPPLSDRLKVTFGFDQPTYQPTDTVVHLTVTLTNTGNKPIAGVIADCNRVGDSNGLFSFDGWGALSINGPGATIPANSTVTFHIDQPMPSGAPVEGFVEAPCVFGPEPDGGPQVGFPGSQALARIAGKTAPEVLQFIRSDNTAVPVAGLRVRIIDEITNQATVATTDTNGEISFPTLPAGLYTVHPLGGFKIPAGQSDVLTARSTDSPSNTSPYEVTPPTN